MTPSIVFGACIGFGLAAVAMTPVWIEFARLLRRGLSFLNTRVKQWFSGVGTSFRLFIHRMVSGNSDSGIKKETLSLV